MENKKWIFLIIFGLSLIGIFVVMPHGESSIVFTENSLFGKFVTINGNYVSNNFTSVLYQKDLATPRILQTRAGVAGRVSAKDSLWKVFPYGFYVADWKGVYGNQFTLRVYTWIKMSSANVCFMITNFNGTTTTTNITVTGNGTYNIPYTGQVVKNCSNSMVTKFTVSSSGGYFSYMVNQSRFGTVEYIGHSTYALHNTCIVLAPTSKVVINSQTLIINMTSNSLFTCDYGLTTPTACLSFDRVNFYVINEGVFVGNSLINEDAFKKFLNITNCNFNCDGDYYLDVSDSAYTRIQNNRFNHFCILTGGFCILENNTFYDDESFYGQYAVKYNLSNNNHFYDVLVAYDFGPIFQGGTIYNATMDSDYISCDFEFGGIVQFIDCTANNWACYPFYNTGSGKIYRSYSFQLRVVNQSDLFTGPHPISGAKVELTPVTGSLPIIYTVSSGYTPRIIINVTKFDKYSLTGTDISSFNVNITKPGFRSINFDLNAVFKSVNMTIQMIYNTTSPIVFSNNHINTSWTHIKRILNNYSWMIYDNDTGNTTPIHTYSNINNAVGTHVNKLNSTGYWDWANYTGNTTTITWFDNHKNTTWSHIKILLVNNSWKIYDNDTGNITSITWINNHLRTVWFHNKTLLLNNSWQITDYDVGNYSGLVLINNSVNTTGVINYQFRPFLGVNGEWWVWVNLTGIPTIIPLSNFTVGLNFTNLPGYINWTGGYVSNNTNISFVVTSNMSLLGNVTINSDDWINIASFNINSQFLLLSVFFGLIYLWWKSEKVSMMFVLAMLIVPYDFVVIIVYLLPLYITDANILLFMQIIFMLISVVVIGYTLDYRSKNKKEEKQSGE